MRLEKMVKLMEDHQDRAQAQRTRLENRIAQLELALQRNKEQRYVREQSLSSFILFRLNSKYKFEKLSHVLVFVSIIIFFKISGG